MELLKGLKVLDFTTLLPGPYATMMLSDMGADVLRILAPNRKDGTAMAPPKIPNTSITASHAWLSRGKKSMYLDLKKKESIEVVKKLIGTYDVIIEQFRPGVMEKLGLGYEELQKVNPSLIYCSITGYGQTGPLKNRAGHDINYLALSGLMSHSGKRETGPVLHGLPIADIAAGSNNALIGILAAVIQRTASGAGQYIDVSMMDGVVAFNALKSAAYLVSGREASYEDQILNGGSLYDFYETSDHRYMSFGGLEPKFFANFCNAIGKPELIENGVWPKNTPEVKQQIREVFLTKTQSEWIEIFSRTDACVEPVLSIGEALHSENARERGMVKEFPLPEGLGSVRQVDCPIRFKDQETAHPVVGLPDGYSTAEVLSSLGYTDDEIQKIMDGNGI